MKTFIQENKKKIQLFAILAAVFFALFYIKDLLLLLGTALAIFSPFLYGLALAFVLDLPVSALDRLLCRWFKKKKGDLRAPCIALVVLLAAAVVSCIVLLMIPQFSSAATLVVNYTPRLIDTVRAWLAEQDLAWLQSYLPTADSADLDALRGELTKAAEFLLHGLSSSTEALGYAVQGVWSGILTVLSAVYMLGDKKRLLRQMEKLSNLYAQKRVARARHALSTAHGMFTKFVVGQFLMAALTGAVVFLLMMVARIPQAALVSSICGVLSLVPMFGAVIGCALGALLVLISSPIDAVWFILLFLGSQIILGNVIYPRVMGDSVGLPAFWTLVAVTVGGGLMGVSGMLVFVPLCATVYQLLRERADARTPDVPLSP